MDTRSKILSMDALSGVLATGEWLAIVGLFDPLTAEQARRLAGFSTQSRKRLAIVLESENALLPAEARAVVIAALGEVDAVFIAPPDRWRLLIPPGAHVEIIEDEAGECARSEDFVQFVLRRQNA